MTTRMSSLAVNWQAQAIADRLIGGFLDVMTGDQPESADKAVPDEQRLARCALSTVPFALPKDGELIANVIEKTIAIRDGEPTWFRLKTSNDETVIDGGRAQMLLKADKLVAGQIVGITEYVHKVPRSSE